MKNYDHEELEKDLAVLIENGIIDDASKNLRSKIDNLTRSIKNLSEKKLRIDFEIKKQKKSLESKRMELKKVSKSTTRKIKIALEQESITVLSGHDPSWLDNYLLRESNKVLED